MNPKCTALILAILVITIPVHAASYYPIRLDDPKAVYLTRQDFPVRADGVVDDADALQQAIDRVQETTHQGIVFIPEGQYRLGKTVHVWNGIRLIGYGSHRPVFILGENTPGFQEGDGTTFIPAMEDPRGTRPMRALFSTIDLTRAYGLAAAPPNRPFYVADEFGQKTWKFSVLPDGSLADPKLFAEEGEAGLTTDADGNVYVAAGNIFVYDRLGKQIGLIEVPERPTSLVFGGKDRQTLFIAARSSLYGVRTKFKGQ